MKLPWDPSCPSVSWSVGRLVCWKVGLTVIISRKGGNFQRHDRFFALILARLAYWLFLFVNLLSSLVLPYIHPFSTWTKHRLGYKVWYNIFIKKNILYVSQYEGYIFLTQFGAAKMQVLFLKQECKLNIMIYFFLYLLFNISSIYSENCLVGRFVHYKRVSWI